VDDHGSSGKNSGSSVGRLDARQEQEDGQKVVPGHSYFCIVKLCKMQVWSRSPHNPRHCTGTHGHEAGAAAVSLMARRWLSASRRLLAPFTSTRSREQRALTASADPASIVAAAGKAPKPERDGRVWLPVKIFSPFDH